MKHLFILTTALLLTALVTQAQTIDDAKKDIYYERYETAKNNLQTIIKNPDAAPEAWYLLSEIYLEQKKMDSAVSILKPKYDVFVQQDVSKKSNPLVYIGWAHVLLDSNKTTEARALIEDVLSASRNKDEIALWAAGKANVESVHGDSLWAVELLKQAVKRDKKNPQIYVTLGDAYRRLIDGSNAVIAYDQALNYKSDLAEAMFKKGRIYKSQNNPIIYVDRFNQALEMDSTYTPALYELYYYYYFRDVKRAADYLNAYIRHAEPSPEHEYMLADLNYVSKNYKEAIIDAKNIITKYGEDAEPRMYKMMAYSYASLGDSAAALDNMNVYFDKQDDTSFVSKDYELKAKLLETLNPDKSTSVELYRKAIAMEKDTSIKVDYYASLADLQKELGNREREAIWREKIYKTKPNATNLDLYKWGMALYSDKDYVGADTVFAMYAEKYPEQLHGYLWRARANALIDTSMTLGLAVPHYKKLAEVAILDSVKNERVLLTAYEYLGAYEANITKNYLNSIGWFNKIIAIDPENVDANNNVKILSKWVEEGKGVSNENKEAATPEDGSSKGGK